MRDTTQGHPLDNIGNMSNEPASSPGPNRVSSHDGLLRGDSLKNDRVSEQTPSLQPEERTGGYSPVQEYRVYKRRFIGLFALALLNLVVSWDWLTYAAVSTTASQFYNVSVSDINWLSTAFLFAFAVGAPPAVWIMNHYGARGSIFCASALVLAGNWIRYGATRASPPSFGLTMFGQILIGLSQPFVLAAPTPYANTWFSDKGRVSAIAVPSLANPLGAALGELIAPIWATEAQKIPDMVLYTAILSTAVCIAAPFVKKAPPSPPSAVAAAKKLDARAALRALPKNGNFWLIFITFSVYVAGFNAISTLVNQIFEPYGLSELDAGIAGGLLILVGLIASAIVSPIVDRTKQYLLIVKLFIPLAAICYLALIFVPQTRTVAGPFVVCSLIGAFSIGLLPAALELLAIVTHPIPPEFASAIAWVGGQVVGAIFVIIMTALESPSGWNGQPPGTMIRALIFQAVIAWVTIPVPMFLGVWKFKRIVIFGDAPTTRDPA